MAVSKAPPQKKEKKNFSPAERCVDSVQTRALKSTIKIPRH
jgi:hypothetical protein